jgi:hypothetical protein
MSSKPHPKATSFDLSATSPAQVRLKKPKRFSSTGNGLKKVNRVTLQSGSNYFVSIARYNFLIG